MRRYMIALRASFTDLLQAEALARGDDDEGVRRPNRRTIVGEGANARQTIFYGARHRRTGQHKGEGENEADRPHLTVSGVPCGAWRRICCGLDNHEPFPEICAKSRKWFRRRENCFVACGSDETIPIMASYFKGLSISFNGPTDAGPLSKFLAALLAGCEGDSGRNGSLHFVWKTRRRRGSVMNQGRLEADSQESSNFRRRCALSVASRRDGSHGQRPHHHPKTLGSQQKSDRARRCARDDSGQGRALWCDVATAR